MTTYARELQEMMDEADRQRETDAAKRPPRSPRYECDCGRVFGHPDGVIYCAQNRHR